MGEIVRHQGSGSDELANRTAVATEALVGLAEDKVDLFSDIAYASNGVTYRYVATTDLAGATVERWVEIGNPSNVQTSRPAGWMGKAANLPSGAQLGTVRYRAVADVGSTVSIGDIIHAAWVLNGNNEPTQVIVNTTKAVPLASLPTSAAIVEAITPSSVMALGQTWTDGQSTPSFYVLRDTGTAQSFVKLKGPGAATLSNADTLSLVTGSTTVNTTFPAETPVVYRANVAGTGYAVGNYLYRVIWVNRDTPTAVAGSFWFNASSGLMLTTPPTIGNLEPVTGSGGGGGGGTVDGSVSIELGGAPVNSGNPFPVTMPELEDAETLAHAIRNVEAPTAEIDTVITTAVSGGFLYTLAAAPARKRGWFVNNGGVPVRVRESASDATATIGAELPPGGTYAIDTPNKVTVFSTDNTVRLYGLVW